MIKTVTYFEYQALKVIGTKITVLRANDNTATIVIGKQAIIKNINRRSSSMKYFNNSYFPHQNKPLTLITYGFDLQ